MDGYGSCMRLLSTKIRKTSGLSSKYIHPNTISGHSVEPQDHTQPYPWFPDTFEKQKSNVHRFHRSEVSSIKDTINNLLV